MDTGTTSSGKYFAPGGGSGGGAGGGSGGGGSGGGASALASIPHITISTRMRKMCLQ